MIPVLYKFVFVSALSQIFLYLVGAGVVVYAAWSGWRGAHGPPNAKTGEFDPPTKDDRVKRALFFGVIGAALAGVGFYYALPDGSFLGKKGEGLPIHTYGVLLASGFVCAVSLAARLAYKEWGGGEEGAKRRDQILDLAFYVLISGLLGSHILFVVVNYKDYLANPINVLKPGGLVFYGGLLGAMLTSVWFAKKNDMDFLRLADIGLPAVSIGQAFGRLGCFSAGCCWGDVAHEGFHLGVHFPGNGVVKNLFGQLSGTASLAYQSMASDTRWVVESTGKIFPQKVDGAVRVSDWVTQHGSTLPLHPTQLYESLGQIGLLLLMLLMRRYRRFHGQIFGMWLMGYAMLRSTVELFRGDLERGTLSGLLSSLGVTDRIPKEAWYNLSISQFISICMFSLGATVLIRKNPPQPRRDQPSRSDG
jgi:phosphatidylglycerol---prolipoprotein diacylglyceryl transferase